MQQSLEEILRAKMAQPVNVKGKEISALRERVKADTGITDEKVNPKDDEEEGVSEAQG